MILRDQSFENCSYGVKGICPLWFAVQQLIEDVEVGLKIMEYPCSKCHHFRRDGA